MSDIHSADASITQEGPSHALLTDLDRTLYRILQRKTGQSHRDENFLLLSKAMQLLGMANRPLHPAPNLGDIRTLLDHNGIYYRHVTLPKDLNSSEYQLLILFRENDESPCLLSRSGRTNRILTVQDGDVIALEDKLPPLMPEAIEVYPLLPERLRGGLDVLRFTYGRELGAIAALVVVCVLVVGFSLAIPVLTDTLVSQVLPETDYQLLLESLVVVTLIIIASITSQYLQGITTLRMETISDLRLQTALWDRFTKLPLLFIRNYKIGDLNSRIGAIYQIRSQISASTLTSLISALFSLAFFALMLNYNTDLALWAASLTLIVYAAIVQIARLVINVQDQINPIKAEISNFGFYSICGLPQIRTLGAEAFVLNQWMKHFSDFARVYLRSNLLAQLIDLLTNLLSTAGSLLLFTVVIIEVLAFPTDFNDPSSIARFIAFYVAFITFTASMSSATAALADVFANVTSLWKRCEKVLYQGLESGHSPEAIQHTVEGHFSLQEVSFQFPGSNQNTFTNLNIEIEAGSYLAITGPSGAGKSTLLKLITGLVPPTSGDILVDQIPLRLLAIRPYRRQLGIVIQDARLDNGSILDVVLAGRYDPEEAVWQALEQACVADEVRRMPSGIHTQIINGGSNISGGQRQRLALARALLPRPKVLLLDEATSAIDTVSQQKISDTINGLGITRIAIAHRLSTLRNADRVVVIENATISQQGSFQDLLTQEGYLRRMVELEGTDHG